METWEITFTDLPMTTVVVEAKNFEEAQQIARQRPEIRDAVMTQIIAEYTNGARGKRLRFDDDKPRSFQVPTSYV